MPRFSLARKRLHGAWIRCVRALFAERVLAAHVGYRPGRQRPSRRWSTTVEGYDEGGAIGNTITGVTKRHIGHHRRDWRAHNRGNADPRVWFTTTPPGDLCDSPEIHGANAVSIGHGARTAWQPVPPCRPRADLLVVSVSRPYPPARAGCRGRGRARAHLACRRRTSRNRVRPRSLGLHQAGSCGSRPAPGTAVVASDRSCQSNTRACAGHALGTCQQ